VPANRAFGALALSPHVVGAPDRIKLSTPQTRLFVAETRTGKIVRDLPYTGTPEWLRGLNTTGSLSADIPLGGTGFPKADLAYLTSTWRYSLGLAWGNYVLQAGPIVLATQNGSSMNVSAMGIWGIFSNKRITLNVAQSGPITGANLDVVFGPSGVAPVGNQGLSLHSVCRRLVELDISRSNHGLPIVLPAVITGTVVRTYFGYDTKYVGANLLDATQEMNGPEIEFSPRFTDGTQTTIEWAMRIGNYRLGQLGFPHTFDYGQALTDVEVTIDGTDQTFRDIERGNGTERGLIIGDSGDRGQALVADGWPRLETIGTDHSSETDAGILAAYAQATEATYEASIQSWNAEIRLDAASQAGVATGSPTVDQITSGDTAIFHMDRHEVLSDGDYFCRILGLQQGSTGDTAQLLLQQMQT
jgi:hypothetical protein